MTQTTVSRYRGPETPPVLPRIAPSVLLSVHDVWFAAEAPPQVQWPATGAWETVAGPPRHARRRPVRLPWDPPARVGAGRARRWSAHPAAPEDQLLVFDRHAPSGWAGSPGLAVAPPALAVHNLTARYRDCYNDTLRGVEFAVDPGGLTAIIGPSGGGKSTLCKVIVGDAGITDGDVRLAGAVQTASLMSYVPQVEAMITDLTVGDTLEFAARLRLPKGTTADECSDQVAQVLERLRLTDQEHQMVSSLSGGQKKRVSIAMELLSEPRLLVMDEPTSGLDEGLDRALMGLLRDLPDVTCLVVTHSTVNLDLATQCLAITSDGEIAYDGPPSGLQAWFGADSFSEVMDALRWPGSLGGYGLSGPGSLRALTARDGNNQRRATSPPRRRQRRRVASRRGPSHRRRDGVSRAGRSRRGTRPVRALPPPPTVPALSVLWRRELRRWWPRSSTPGTGWHLPRDRRLMHLLWVPLAVAFATWLTGPDGLSGTAAAPRERLGATLNLMNFVAAFFAMALTAPTLVDDFDVIKRERRWGVSTGASVMARALLLVPLAFVQACIAVTAYLLLRPGPQTPLDLPVPAPLFIVLILGLVNVAAACLGLAISALSSTSERATQAIMGAAALQVLLSGVVVPFGRLASTLDAAMSWASYLVPTRWGVAAMAAITDMQHSNPGTPDAMWNADGAHVLWPLGILALLSVTFLGLAMWAISRRVRALE